MRSKLRTKKLPSARFGSTGCGFRWFRFVILSVAVVFLIWAAMVRSHLSKSNAISGFGLSLDLKKTTGNEGDSGATTAKSDIQLVDPISYGHLKPRRGKIFSVNSKSLKTYVIRRKIVNEGLERVYLDHHLFGPTENHACKGPRCPDFDYCYREFKGIGACSIDDIMDETEEPTSYPVNCPTKSPACVQPSDLSPHEKWTAQVFVLHNVYVNFAGQVFNTTHVFDHNGCEIVQHFSYPRGKVNVTEFEDLVTVADWFGWNARSNMLEILPSFVLLSTVLPALKGIPIAYGQKDTHKKNQLEQLQAIGIDEILGADLDSMNPTILPEKDLFFAKRLFLPLKQRCQRPSKSFWKDLRYNNFLARDGLPIYSDGWNLRSVTPGGRPLAKNDDWIVLLGMKKEKTPLVDTLKLEEYLKTIFPPQRVQVYFEGSVPMLRRKDLLNKARLLVAVHGNVLADMVFMPPGGAVVEIRPREDGDATFHHLAEACELSYYLTFCDGKPADGKRPSTLHVKNVKHILGVLKSISIKFT